MHAGNESPKKREKGRKKLKMRKDQKHLKE